MMFKSVSLGAFIGSIPVLVNTLALGNFGLFILTAALIGTPILVAKR